MLQYAIFILYQVLFCVISANKILYAVVCKGKSARYSDVENVDWVPSINLGYKIKDEQVEWEQLYEQVVQLSEEDVTEELTEEKLTQTNVSKFSVGSQTDDSITGMSSDIICTYQEKIALLEGMSGSNTNSITPTAPT